MQEMCPLNCVFAANCGQKYVVKLECERENGDFSRLNAQHN